MSVFSKILTLWAALFLTVAPIPRCATLMIFYDALAAWFDESEAGALAMACHHASPDKVAMTADRWTASNTEASCRCIIDDFLKVRLAEQGTPALVRTLEPVRSLEKATYRSKLHLNIPHRQDLRPPIG